MDNQDVARRLIINLSQCESEVQNDVLRRCSDWLDFGGQFTDPYIIHQLQFTDRHLQIKRAKDSLT